jgi:hypothetical protein
VGVFESPCSRGGTCFDALIASSSATRGFGSADVIDSETCSPTLIKGRDKSSSISTLIESFVYSVEGDDGGLGARGSFEEETIGPSVNQAEARGGGR